jgi:hypothetical protein
MQMFLEPDWDCLAVRPIRNQTAASYPTAQIDEGAFVKGTFPLAFGFAGHALSATEPRKRVQSLSRENNGQGCIAILLATPPTRKSRSLASRRGCAQLRGFRGH